MIFLAKAYVQLYRETGIYGERTAPWVKRMGADWVRQKLSSEEEAAGLAERFDHAKTTYREAWSAALEDEERRRMYTVEKP